MSMLADRTLSKGAVDFIDDARLQGLLDRPGPDRAELNDIIAKALDKQALTVDETSRLVQANEPEQVERIFDAARDLKRRVYGNRIVLFAPLYIGNKCVNECAYCGFRRTVDGAIRRTLRPAEIEAQVRSLLQAGHKRLILVYGTHDDYNPEFMADCVRRVYAVKEGHGNIRRVNINAPPLSVDGYRTVKAAGIGTYQIFQETYHHATYRQMHPADTRKGDYLYRLDGLSRALEGECDDVGIGALFGLYDWRFEVLGLVQHAVHLQERYKVGPHTISFPRLRPAFGVHIPETHFVHDDDFKRLIAILRLAVPYTGLILTARETPDVRRAVMEFGVSQIDAGSRIEIAGYTESKSDQEMDKEQFSLGDIRPLDEVMRELLEHDFVPSFCTACYRLGRTGEHFMEFAIPGFIKRYCTPNALTTLMEYLTDYASEETRQEGMRVIQDELDQLENTPMKAKLIDRLGQIQSSDARDLYF